MSDRKFLSKGPPQPRWGWFDGQSEPRFKAKRVNPGLCSATASWLCQVRIVRSPHSLAIALLVSACLCVTIFGQTPTTRPRTATPLPARPSNPPIGRDLTREPVNNWGLASNFASNLADQLVRYPNSDVAFICGPQLKAGSSVNPFPWFDSTARGQGNVHGEMAPRIAPIGPMRTDSATGSWDNVIQGRVSVAGGSTVVNGKGSHFLRDIDPTGAAPYYNGNLRIRDSSGTIRSVKVKSVDTDSRLTLSAPWPFASVSDTVADTFFHELNPGTNTDHYYLSNYYDTALVQYINYYRTGDARFLMYARKTADALWHSQYLGDGTVIQGNSNHLPPRSMAFAGLMLRALDGRPEMWDYLEREARATFEHWVYRRKNDPKLYYDIREDGYAQLYAVLMAKVLPNTYPLYPAGTLKQRAGTATDGAARRATLLSQTEDTAVNFFGRLQWPDGSWRWNEDGSKPDDQLRDIEQPFMVGLYLESVILLHQLTRSPSVKASLARQLTRSVRHLYTDTFQRNNPVTDLPPLRWRSLFYFWGGGSVVNPKKFNPPPPKTTANGEREAVAAARHFQSTVHHAFGYAYYITGDAAFKEMGDDVFEASFGDRVDGIHCLAASGKAKDYDMNYRASGRYLVWRLAHQSPVAQNVQTASTSRTLANPTFGSNDLPSPSAGSPGSTPIVISNAFLTAKGLSANLSNKEQIEELIDQIENAMRMSTTYGIEKRQFVGDELRAALGHARTALSMVGSESGLESARLRIGWAAARLKRASETMQSRAR